MNPTINLKTPLIRLTNLEKTLGWTGQLWAKCEFQNPTGSFKDRGSVVEINQALKQNKKGVVCASTGNLAISVAAFATQKNLPCVVFIPQQTSSNKLKQATTRGAVLKKVINYDQCVIKAKQFASQQNYFLCGNYELRRYGQSNIGLELATSGIDFDTFVVPVGNGTLGCSIAEGFAVYGKFPQFLGVQGLGADPVYRAWKKNKVITQIKKPQTVASSICIGNPMDGKLTLAWIKRTRGQMVAVTDKQIIDAQKFLAKTEGIYVETAAATTLAGLQKTKTKIQALTVVLILTGSGLKE